MATKKYWKGIDELQETPAFVESRDREFAGSSSVDEFLGDESLKETSTARRDFLKFLGFSVAAATVAACEAPVTKAIPYVLKPENVTPGQATWYASTYYDGNAYASILVKTREGRPIYIKGNRDHGFTQGAVTPSIVASVLGLYDGARLRTVKGADSWSKLDDTIKAKLAAIKAKQGKIAFVTNSVISPSMQMAMAELSTALYGETKDAMGFPSLHPNFNHVQYDAVSYNGIRQANLESFGKASIPDYDFTEAKTIVSIGADFLSTWLLGNAFSSDYGKRRKPDGEWMSRHFQFESVMSISGSNADYRAMIKPSEQANVLAYLLGKFGANAGGASATLSKEAQKVADEAFKSLKQSKGQSVIICGSNNKAVQILTNKLNSVLGAYGKTIRFESEINLFQSQDEKMHQLVNDVIGKKGPDAIFFIGANPVYNLANGKAFGEALKNVDLTVSLSMYDDETATKCDYIAPDHHSLEAWMDYNPKAGHYAIAQPTIRPLHNTASALESLLVWAGKASRGGKDSRVAYDYIAKTWELYGFPQQTTYTDFHTYWSMAVHNSAAPVTPMPAAAVAFNDASLGRVSGNLPKGGDLEVVLYQKAGITTGDMAGNPWLQELADPISKVTWDNYITMNPHEMEKAGYRTTYDQENGLNLATVTVGGEKITLPVYPSPGQALGTVGIALGYGRGENNEEVGNGAFQTEQYGGFTMKDGKRVPVGKNAYRFKTWANGGYTTDLTGSIKSEGSELYPIAATQIHHTVMARHSIVRETTLGIFEKEDKEVYNPSYKLQKLDAEGNHVEAPMEEFDLWDAHPVENVGHRWGMSIDLNQCFGCGACVIACQSENNVPVVGKDEVRRGREMAWLRIDRYYASDEEATIGTRKGKLDFDKAEHASLNPKVVHMPMLCQHCNHAPCETVCPVAATTHSNEGLNQMTYNRCIGTRYCANNCPYKVRRFNWFNYPSYKKFTEINPAQDDLGRMVLNPDVTVRTRGVMEKCSFCVQRVQGGKLDAKKESRPVIDGEITTACQESCPADAISFGDWNDIKSSIRKSSADKRSYQALEEVGVKPNIWYKVKVRNEENAELDKLAAASHHGQTHREGWAEKKSNH
jgi:MoCo/4Fe-4S cofactor protein with predicted Tat translocation signal